MTSSRSTLPSRSLAAGLVAAAALVGAALPSAAQTLLPPQNVVSLQATASTELTMDWLAITFSATRDGQDAAGVQAQLKQSLDAALAEARKAARPGEVNVRTGGFSLHPRYGQKGGITGWQGSAELVVEGRDAAALSQLAGRIQTLTIARVNWSLSREAREKVEADVAEQAIARFRARADAVARQFGFAGWSIREVNVGSSEPPSGMPVPMLRARAAAADAEALPVEAGKAQVSATVSGSVQLK
jgi:predicted secreted protein